MSNLEYILFGLSILLAVHWSILSLRIILKPKLLPILPSESKDELKRPRVSILVAVRNEADRILKKSITSFLNQDYPDFEVVVVDDHSTDDTRLILDSMEKEFSHLKISSSDDGRIGKREAILKAVNESDGSWFLFTDADVIMEKDALVRGIDYALTNDVDALSLLNVSEAESFWEQVTMVSSMWMAFEGMSLSRANDDDAPVNMAVAAPYILSSKEAYEKTGGYDSFKENIFVDVYLARRFRETGSRYRYLDSCRTVSTRMYSSLFEIWEGFSKNAFLALGGRMSTAIIGIAAYFLITIVPFILLALYLKDSMISDIHNAGLILSILSVVTLYFSQYKASAYMGTAPRLSSLLLSPIGGLLWIVISLNSIRFKLFGGEVKWKNRTISLVESEGD